MLLLRMMLVYKMYQDDVNKYKWESMIICMKYSAIGMMINGCILGGVVVISRYPKNTFAIKGLNTLRDFSTIGLFLSTCAFFASMFTY